MGPQSATIEGIIGLGTIQGRKCGSRIDPSAGPTSLFASLKAFEFVTLSLEFPDFGAVIWMPIYSKRCSYLNFSDSTAENSIKIHTD